MSPISDMKKEPITYLFDLYKILQSGVADSMPLWSFRRAELGGIKIEAV